MVNIFTREITDDLASLVKKIDKKVAENENKKMAGFMVLLSDNPDADQAKLKKFAEKHNITNIPLTVYEGTHGPGSYNIADDAEVTVMMWTGLKVKANHAFKKGEFDKGDIKKIVADTGKILN